MRWLIYNIIFSILLFAILKNHIPLDYNKPHFFLIEFILIFLLLWLVISFFNKAYFYKLPKAVKFIAFIIKELFISNFRIAYEILTPGFSMNPAIIAVPLDVKTDVEIAALATLITLTPGSLSLGISKDRKLLFVHEMYNLGNDLEAVKKRIKENYERRILELSR